MNIIQENAELLTEEGKLLQLIQSDEIVDYDIDAYANRLEEILCRKQVLSSDLRQKIVEFRRQLQQEEKVSKSVRHF